MYVYYMCRNKNEIYKKSEYKIVYLMNQKINSNGLKLRYM